MYIGRWLDVIFIHGNRLLIKYHENYFEEKMRTITAVEKLK
jgi:hypothetical protein